MVVVVFFAFAATLVVVDLAYRASMVVDLLLVDRSSTVAVFRRKFGVALVFFGKALVIVVSSMVLFVGSIVEVVLLIF